MNSDFKVYTCIENGSSGINTTENASLMNQHSPTWNHLRQVLVVMDMFGNIFLQFLQAILSSLIQLSIFLPSDWSHQLDAQIVAVRDNGDSSVNENQIKTIYIENQGLGYSQGSHECNILGDGTGAKLIVEVDSNGRITDTVVSAGGKDYSYGIVDLGSINANSTTKANLFQLYHLQRVMGMIFTKNLVQIKFLFMQDLMILPEIFQLM